MNCAYVVALVAPAAPTVQVVAAVREYWLFAPAHVITIPVTCALAVPVFARVIYGTAGAVVTQVIVPAVPVPKFAAEIEVPVTETCADWDAVPKIPNTKPPIATAAMRVTAMISTVAMMGEMALRCPYFPFLIFIVILLGLGLVYEPSELPVWF